MAQITCDNLDQVITKLHFPSTKVALPPSREVTEADLKLAHTWWRDLDQAFLEDPESAIETGPLFEAAKLKNKSLDYADVKALQKAARTVIKLELAAGLASCIMKEGREVAAAVVKKARTPEELDILRIQEFEKERGFVTAEEAAAGKEPPSRTKEEVSAAIKAADVKRQAKTALKKPGKKGAK